MLSYSVNYVAVVAAAIINMAVGATWYSKLLFSKPWMKLTGRKEMGGGNVGMSYGLTMLAALLQTFVLAVLVVTLNITSVSEGAMLGIAVWLGFAVTTSLSDYLFSGRSLKLWALNQGYYVVVLAVNGALLAGWR